MATVHLVKGSQIEPDAINSGHLQNDSVITDKIKDKSVTPEKLSDEVFALFSSSTGATIHRKYISSKIIANTNIEISGLSIMTSTFKDSVLVFRNGQLLWAENSVPLDPNNPVDVIPGSTSSSLSFLFDLLRGDQIIVVKL